MEPTLYDVSFEGPFPGQRGIHLIHNDEVFSGRSRTYTYEFQGETREQTYMPGISVRLALSTIESGTIGMAPGVSINKVLIDRLKPVSDRPINQSKVAEMVQILNPVVEDLNQTEDDSELQKKLGDACFKLGIIAVSIEGYIIDGLHRWEAFKTVQLPNIACIVVNVLKEEEAEEFNMLDREVEAYRERVKKEAAEIDRQIAELEEKLKGSDHKLVDWSGSPVDKLLALGRALNEQKELFEEEARKAEAEARKAEEQNQKLKLELEKGRAPKLFRNQETAGFASASVISGASDVLAKGVLNFSGFQQDEEGRYFLTSANNTRIYILPRHDTESVYDAITSGGVLRTTLESFSLEAACLNLLYAAKAADLPDPSKPFIYSYEDLCEDLGLDQKKRSSLEKLEKIRSWGLQPGGLSCLVPTLSGDWIEEHKIWDISPRYHKDGNQISFKIRAGMWAEYYLEPDKDKRDKKGSNKTRQISHISKILLSSITKNCQKRPGAARLMLWLLFKHRQDKAQYNPVTVKTCMVHAYGEDAVTRALTDKDSTKNLWAKWENDLLLVHDSRWKIQADNWPDESKPDWMLNDIPTRSKGYFERTLQLKVVIYPPPEIMTELDKLKTEEAKKKPIQIKAREIMPNLAARLKATRTGKGLSQDQAAEVLGIGLDSYKKIEQGKREPKKILLPIIKAWLET